MLPAHIRSLLDPAVYDHPADDVQVIQTHISWVILAGEFAYKIKKPVRFGFLDYSTLDVRRLMCEREVELNRRGCRGAYLGVVPIHQQNGHGRLTGSGPVVEYAVKMRRLPSDGWLSAMVDAGEASADVLKRVARSVHEFHARAATGSEIASFGSASETSAIWRENLSEIAVFMGDTLSGGDFRELSDYGGQFLRANTALIDERAASGRVRDCHGDLRSDSIHIEPDGGICMCDCIEFSDRLRCGDVAGDAAFLAMDLDFRGREDLSDEFGGAYTELAADDETLPYMLPFYRCYRAMVRGKVESITSREPEIEEAQAATAHGRATRYFQRARRYARESTPPTLIVVGGLSGSGKSHFAAALAARAGAVQVRSDAVRREIFSAGSAPEQGVYRPQERARVYVEMRSRARRHLLAGRPVVLDATHIERRERDAARGLAAECHLGSLLVWVGAEEAVIRARLQDRESVPDHLSDARWATYVAQRANADPLGHDEREDCLEVDGAARSTENIVRVNSRWAV